MNASKFKDIMVAWNKLLRGHPVIYGSIALFTFAVIFPPATVVYTMYLRLLGIVP